MVSFTVSRSVITYSPVPGAASSPSSTSFSVTIPLVGERTVQSWMLFSRRRTEYTAWSTRASAALTSSGRAKFSSFFSAWSAALACARAMV